MGINHYWLADQHVLYVHHWDQITLDELRASSNYATIQLRASERMLVHIVVDMRDLKKYPRSIFEISNATSIFREKNLGWVILLTRDGMISFLASTVTQVVGKTRFRSFDDADEALRFLMKVDPGVPDSVLYVPLQQTGAIPEHFFAYC